MKWNLQISISKVFAFVALLAGTITAIKLSSAEVFIVTITATSAIIVNKQYQDRKKQVVQ